ncbi:MAG: hypothetical protein E3J86_13675 [Candidatus Thorarchaeota archaeon]|nr:MAG: hypothetical protein E3J86_13675 [Candidatus Thorarchaeota archaeon]
MGFAILRSVIKGNLNTSLIRKKPLLVPSLVFVFTIIITAIYVPFPMSAYHGPNQREYHNLSIGTFRVYEPGPYEAYTQVRISCPVTSDEWLEVNINFTRNDTVVQTLFFNITDDYSGRTQFINLEPDRYDLTFNATFFVNGAEDDMFFFHVIIYQPVSTSFIPELTAWSSYQFILGFICFFFVLAGIYIGGEDRTRINKEKIDQEPPREGDVYGWRLGW